MSRQGTQEYGGIQNVDRDTKLVHVPESLADVCGFSGFFVGVKADVGALGEGATVNEPIFGCGRLIALFG